MTRLAFLKKYCVRFAAALALLCLIFYTVYHVFAKSEDSLMTIPVREVTDLRLISGEAYLFREESVLTADGQGLVNDLVTGGTKVSPHTPLTQLWSSSAATDEDQLKLDRINRLIAMLEASRLPDNATLSLAEGIKQSANQTFFALQSAMANQNWSHLGGMDDQLLTLLNQYADLTGEGATIAQTREALYAAKEAMQAGSQAVSFFADRSGYYYGRACVDGYENLFTPEALNSLTAESFAALISAEPRDFGASKPMGKLVYGYEWSLAVSFGSEARDLFREGSVYRFSFPENRDREQDLTCTRLLEGEGGGVIAVFTCNEIPAGFAYYRSQRVEITAASTEGYYVPESALCQKDGVDGVYIFKNSTVYFRRIEILYRGDGYCIVAVREEADYLSLYDLLITSGRDVYEGRVYQ